MSRVPAVRSVRDVQPGASLPLAGKPRMQCQGGLIEVVAKSDAESSRSFVDASTAQAIAGEDVADAFKKRALVTR
jgi:hypothetical protein